MRDYLRKNPQSYKLCHWECVQNVYKLYAKYVQIVYEMWSKRVQNVYKIVNNLKKKNHFNFIKLFFFFFFFFSLI